MTHLDFRRSSSEVIKQHRTRQSILDARALHSAIQPFIALRSTDMESHLFNQFIHRPLGYRQSLCPRNVDDLAHDCAREGHGVRRRLEETVCAELSRGRDGVPFAFRQPKKTPQTARRAYQHAFLSRQHQHAISLFPRRNSPNHLDPPLALNILTHRHIAPSCPQHLHKNVQPALLLLSIECLGVIHADCQSLAIELLHLAGTENLCARPYLPNVSAQLYPSYRRKLTHAESTVLPGKASCSGSSAPTPFWNRTIVVPSLRTGFR